MHHGLVTAAILMSLATAAPTAHAVIVRHDRTDAQALELGRKCTPVARISLDGSGTLVHPRWVLTAAHVAHGISPFAPHVMINGRTYTIDLIVIHPDGMRQRGPMGGPPKTDLALLRLAREVADVNPAAIAFGEDPADRDVIIAGYGDYGAGEGERHGTDGNCRGVTNRIESVRSDRLDVRFDAPPAGTDLEGVGAPGDSGGPLFLDPGDDPNAPLTLLGVSSASMGRPGTYGVRDMYVRVSAFTDWIESTFKDPTPRGESLPAPIDVRDGLPAGAEYGVMQAFLDAVNTGESGALVAFSAAHRLEGARQDRSDDAWAEIITTHLVPHRPLAPEQVLETDMDHHLFVRTKDGGGWVIQFLFQERNGQPKLDGLMLRPAGV